MTGNQESFDAAKEKILNGFEIQIDYLANMSESYNKIANIVDGTERQVAQDVSKKFDQAKTVMEIGKDKLIEAANLLIILNDLMSDRKDKEE